jgi:hypothetical protein
MQFLNIYLTTYSFQDFFNGSLQTDLQCRKKLNNDWFWDEIQCLSTATLSMILMKLLTKLNYSKCGNIEGEHWKTRNNYVDRRCWNKSLLYEWAVIFVRRWREGRMSSFEFTKGRRSLLRSYVMTRLLKNYRKSAVDMLTWHYRSPPSCGEVKMPPPPCFHSTVIA